MPVFTTGSPKTLSGDSTKDLKVIRDWAVELIDELNYIFGNLDTSNVTEAGSVKAENIDTTTARIKSAQIEMLRADKINAGTIDLDNKITISGSSDNTELKIDSSSIEITVKGIERLFVGKDKNNEFIFRMKSEDGTHGIVMDESGNAYFTGTIESSEVYSSKIVGTSADKYADPNVNSEKNNIFVELDEKGLTVQHDRFNGNDWDRLKKAGITVDEKDGTAIFTLGAGSGTVIKVNNVEYGINSFVIEKSDNVTVLGLYGSGNPQIHFDEGGGIRISKGVEISGNTKISGDVHITNGFIYNGSDKNDLNRYVTLREVQLLTGSSGTGSEGGE